MSPNRKNAQGVSPSTTLSRLRGCPIRVSFVVARKLGSRVKRETRMEVACQERTYLLQEISRCMRNRSATGALKKHLEPFSWILKVDS